IGPAFESQRMHNFFNGHRKKTAPLLGAADTLCPGFSRPGQRKLRAEAWSALPAVSAYQGKL
ncbi:hypothetical protein KF707_08825, partial [Candidatus Obscuribacterales bacterium]|nr:hypothetical protein [Candidatus Obscuribacterales bacterium]